MRRADIRLVAPMPIQPSPLINPLIPAEDFARHLTVDELAAIAGSAAASGRIAICSGLAEGLSAVRRELGDVRSAALVRELMLFVRRNLRGVDAMAMADDELILLIDTTAMSASAVAERLLAAVRAHVFSTGGPDAAHRFTLSMGIAASPEHGTSFVALLAAARQARSIAGSDGSARAFTPRPNQLDLTRFVGRAEPLGQLADYLDDMVRGVGHVVAIVGERGVGASSLVRTLAPEVRLRGGSMVSASCREHRLATPYSLWSEVLRAVRRLPVKSTRLWRELPALDPTLERASGDAARGGSKTLLLEELADYLRLAAQQRPLALLLENLQWADSASWDALEYLITQLESERILLALTFQSGTEDDALERWSGLATRPRHSEIRLTHLTRDDVKRWLESAMRAGELARDLLAYVYRHSAGNPLVLTHLMRDLEESGHIVLHDDGWQSSSVSELPAAASLEDLIARRIARLPEAARNVLEAAAVIGREAEEALLLESASDASDARQGLDRLIDRGLLVSTYDRGKAAYVVSHDEVARIASRRLAPARSAELHGRIARALAARDNCPSAEIAGHFELAGDRSEAHRYALLAADEALVLHETSAVAELLAVAERCAPEPAALAEVRVRMAFLAEVAGRYEDAESLCDQSLEWYSSQGDQVQALRLKRTRALVRMKRGLAARETLTELLALEAEASEANEDMERAAVLLHIAQIHWRLGDQHAAQRVAEEAVVIAERGDDVVLLADACNRLAVTIQLENAPRARALFVRALDIATSLGDAFRRVRGLNNIGVLETICNNSDEAWRVLTIAVEQARTAGIIESWGRAELNLGVLAGRIGNYDGALRAFSEALRLMSMVQNSEEQLYATYNLADLQREHDHARKAADTYELVVDLAERIDQVPIQAGALAGLGLCRLDLGEYEGAKDAMDRSVALSEGLEWFPGRECLEALKLHLLIRDGEYEAAVAMLESFMKLAHVTDISAAAWLIAMFGLALRPHAPEMVEAAVKRYAGHPEVMSTPKMKSQFAVLMLDS
jgi:tetratricopeptide (TPR) repeat protein/GGDEF domain-containing protein